MLVFKDKLIHHSMVAFCHILDRYTLFVQSLFHDITQSVQQRLPTSLGDSSVDISKNLIFAHVTKLAIFQCCWYIGLYLGELILEVIDCGALKRVSKELYPRTQIIKIYEIKHQSALYMGSLTTEFWCVGINHIGNAFIKSRLVLRTYGRTSKEVFIASIVIDICTY